MNKSLSEITANVNVGIDEVVSVFVTEYEDNLFDRKKSLSVSIKQAKQDAKDLIRSLENSIDRSEFEMTVPVLDLVSTVESVTVVFKGNQDGNYNSVKQSEIHVKVKVSDNSSTSKYNDSLTKTFKTRISETDDIRYTSLLLEQSELSGELVEIMSLIKSVSRKERQVRGKISKMKLEESGFEDLLNNDEMLKLIQLD